MKNKVFLNVICILFIIISGLGICYAVFGLNPEKGVDKLNSYQQDSMKTPPERPNGEQVMGERPEMPSGERPEMPEGEKMERPQMEFGEREDMMHNDNGGRNWFRNVLIVVCVLLIIISVTVLILINVVGKFNIKIIIVSVIVDIILTSLFSLGILFVLGNGFENKIPINENNLETLETSAEDIKEGVVVTSKDINLNDYSSNITIKNSGEYDVSGSFKYSILVNSDSQVILNLNDVYIDASMTSAIANIGNAELVINLVKGSSNVLKDGGYSEYDGCIYSKASLVIQGEGTLKVYGGQQEGEGIATTDNDITINGGNIIVESNDDGLNAGGDNGGIITINDGSLLIKASGDGIDSNGKIVINGGSVYANGSALGGDAGIDADKGIELNGGTIIALGSDMLEKPSVASQKYIAVTLNETIKASELITLINEDDKVVVSFKATENFKTLIISSKDLKNGNYYLYQGGSNSGDIDNNIYSNHKYTKGSLIKVNNSDAISVK